jgi:isopentenyl-diphosphate Delta-isomerase
MNAQEWVILVDLNDQETGRMEKLEAHRKGELHRAFSVFLFNDLDEMLLQQRALTKYHSPGLWTNACCSHPRPGESISQAAQRRLMEEMGIDTKFESAFSFTYRAEFENGLIEHELDHVLIGRFSGIPAPHPEEVLDWKFLSVDCIIDDVANRPELYTAWFKLALPKLLNVNAIQQ